MGKRTALYDAHLKANATMVEFAGWEMPLNYGSQLQEHHQVRQHAGVFDVSHMAVVDIKGTKANAFLGYLLANDVNRLTMGKALYTCMLNEEGGIKDDLIVYKIADDFYRCIINAGTREKDIDWMRKHAPAYDVKIIERNDFSILAVQGPEVINKLDQFLSPKDAELVKNLRPFNFVILNNWFIARTGYTGEDGYELIVPNVDASLLWQRFLAAGIMPCGLGARDTLRLEAGLNLYGEDMDENIGPFESNLGWTVAFEPPGRKFIGREKLEQRKQEGIKLKLIGLVLSGPGIMRGHQNVSSKDNGCGIITSGGYSPTLKKSIALARVPESSSTEYFVEIRGRKVPAQMVKPPFVRHGKKMF